VDVTERRLQWPGENHVKRSFMVCTVTVHLLSRLAVTGAGYSSGIWIHPRDYTGGLKAT
jgi:hypothetical protein